MKNLQYLVRLRAYAKRYNIMHLPVSLIESCYEKDLDMSNYNRNDDRVFG
jgi:hypothetical protein